MYKLLVELELNLIEFRNWKGVVPRQFHDLFDAQWARMMDELVAVLDDLKEPDEPSPQLPPAQLPPTPDPLVRNSAERFHAEYE